LSSAILYLAIVAIWLGVLVPRWLRPAQFVARSVETRHRADATPPWSDSDSDTEPIPVVRPDHDQRGSGFSPAARRRAILQARQRMLLMISVLTVGAVVIAVAHMAAWWVVVAPGFMLGGFLVLLREAAHTDAERAGRLADAHARTSVRVREDAAEGVMAAEEVRAPVAEPAPTWTATIIDISARLSDQLYDQYSDAAVRAIGD
jgi:hypothetical protein